jgi:hypothetical protein
MVTLQSGTESPVAPATLCPLVIRDPRGPHFVHPDDTVIRAVFAIPLSRAPIDNDFGFDLFCRNKPVTDPPAADPGQRIGSFPLIF